jgi:hypothetical protein
MSKQLYDLYAEMEVSNLLFNELFKTSNMLEAVELVQWTDQADITKLVRPWPTYSPNQQTTWILRKKAAAKKIKKLYVPSIRPSTYRADSIKMRKVSLSLINFQNDHQVESGCLHQNVPGTSFNIANIDMQSNTARERRHVSQFVLMNSWGNKSIITDGTDMLDFPFNTQTTRRFQFYAFS